MSEWYLHARRPRRGTASRTIGLFGPHRGRLAVLFLMLVASAAVELIPALLIGQLVDDPLSDTKRTILLGASIFGLYAVSGVLDAGSGTLSSIIGNNVMYDLRRALHGHVQRLSLRFYTSSRTGEILSRVSTDVNQVENSITVAFVEFVNSFILVSIAIGLMFALDWRLSTLAIVVMVMWILPTAWVARYLRRLQKLWAEEAAQLSAHLEETLSVSGSLLVRAFGRQEFEAERFERESDALRSLAIRRRVVAKVFETITKLFGSVAIGFVYWLGSQWISSGAITAGSVVTFALLAQRVFQPAAFMARSNTNIVAALALFERIFEYLDMPVEIDDKPDAIHLARPQGRITFEDVTFSYEATSAPAVRDLSFELEPGQMAALVGPSGSGKSTVTYLMQRFYDPDQGSVRLDGVDVRDLARDSVTRSVGVVMQDTALFHTTLAENIRYGRLDATDAEVRQAASIAALDDLIERLPDGLDTVVGERGFRLSGGEKQRVSIARAVLKDPPVLIMDEATSALDSRLERDIREATERLAAGRTTVVIAHRLSTVVAADVIFVMSEGRIVERGRHEELLAKRGLYAALYREQYGTAVAV